MAAHRKFTFDDPEDSYWNENGPLTIPISAENPSTSNVIAARAALENLFESQARFGIEDGFWNTENEPRIATVENSVKKNYLQSTRKKLCPKSPVISEGSAESVSSYATAQLDYSRLKAEHRKLQKHLEQVRLERYRPSDPEVTVRRLLQNDPVSLDLYRSMNEKLDLLEAALDSYDGNVILAVLLALERSLETSLFMNILNQKPSAAHHYVAYLKQMKSFDQLITTLLALNRMEEALLVMYRVSYMKQPSERISYLKKCLHLGAKDPSLEMFCKSVNEYIDLLERQIVIEDADEVSIKKGNNVIFHQYPKSVTLIGRPVLTTLYYSCLYHFDLPVNAYSSPLSIKQFFRMTEKQYAWMAISALSRLKRWNDVDGVLMSKKLLGGVKTVCPFAWRHLFAIISASGNQAPKEVQTLLRAVPDVNERHHLAIQFPQAADIVIECLVAQKDRSALSAFLSKLTPQTAEAYKAISALNNAVSADLCTVYIKIVS
ncbi:unnamed protein product [Thelazia callipaeda]|uniref:Vps16_C domain-containing protein n=1 Tax=Thelazia callipaeda TaxID=103827 RepID=A0A0N5D3S7_THECL|nr:unnamed protein product [Thelazia callipaeda]